MNTIAGNRVALSLVLALLICQIVIADAGKSRTPGKGAPRPGVAALGDSVAARNWETVRWWFHRPAFHVRDDLEDYYNNGADGRLINAPALLSTIR